MAQKRLQLHAAHGGHANVCDHALGGVAFSGLKEGLR
jgi:hypothetical protein